MTILLITLLTSLLNGGPEEIFVAADLVKEIKHNVKDKDRKAYILEIMKDTKSEIKSFRKSHDKNSEKIGKLLKNEDVNVNQIKKIISKDTYARASLQDYLISNRIKLQDTLTDTEWKLILEKSQDPTSKTSIKKLKKDNKNINKLKKVCEKIKQDIENTVSDESKKQTILSALERFILEFKEQLKTSQELTYLKTKILNDQHATKEMLAKVYENQDKERKELHESFYNLFQTTKENTTQKEWKKLKKEFHIIFD